MHHLDQHVLIKLVVVLSTAVVIVYFAALGYIDFAPTQSTGDAAAVTALTPTQAGQALVDDGEVEEAISLYRTQVATLEGELATATLNLAGAYQASLQLADAEALYRKALRLDPLSLPAYLGLATVLADQNQAAQAATVVSAGLEQFPGDADLLAVRAQLEGAQAE